MGHPLFVVKKHSGTSELIARAQLKPGDLQRNVKIYGETVNVDGMYLRILCHDDEHMDQLIAYVRIQGIVPPRSASVVLPK
jgi:hypothetical protein